MKRTYEVIVGNVGIAYTGHNKRDAVRTFNAYVKVSKSGVGRCAGEPVTMLADNDITGDYLPATASDE